MGWISSVWRQRAAVTLVHPNALVGDYDVSIPEGWDGFWDVIDTSGNELRLNDAAGNALDYGLSGFNKTNRTGTIRINGHTPPTSNGCVEQVFLSFDSTSTQGSGAGTAGTGGRSGFIELSKPGEGSGIMLSTRSPIAGLTNPPQRISITESSRNVLWLGYGAMLAPSFTSCRGASVYEETYFATHNVVDTANISVTTMFDIEAARFVWIPRGEHMGTWLRVILRAGTAGNWYTSSIVSRIVAPGALSPIRSTVDVRTAIYTSLARL